MSPTTVTLPALMTTADVAAYLGVPVKTVYEWRTKHTGPQGLRVGRHTRYRATDVERWLTQQAS